MPRPIPVSKNDAERDMLNVTMHWYGFQMLTIRSSFSLPVVTWNASRQVVPAAAEGSQRGVDRRRVEVARDHRAGRAACRGGREPGGSNFASSGFSRVAEHEHELLRLAGRELEPDLVRADRLPAVGDRAGGRAALHGQRPVPAAVRPEERVAVGVEARRALRAGEEGEVVAPLAVLGLVVDHAVLDLDLAGREVALVVGRVVVGVPQAELDDQKSDSARRVRGARW